MRRLAVLMVLFIILLLFAAASAHASTAVQHHRQRLARRIEALDWAVTQRGLPYTWGGTGPYGYDCSGLVYRAYRRLGLDIPRTTWEMLGSWRLVRTWHPEPGDLAFFGSGGHVELVTRHGDETYGALEPGTTLGWHRESAWWRPSMYFHVRGSG